MATKTGFIKDYNNNILLPFTRAELVKDSSGACAFRSNSFAATQDAYGLMSPDDKKKLDGSDDSSLSSLQSSINKLKDSITVNSIACNLLDDVLNFKNSNNIVVSKDTNDNITFDFANTVAFKNATVQKDPTEGIDVVNKSALDKALDDKFKEAIAVASGALHFKGGITALPSTTPEEGSYYKVTDDFSFTQGSTSINVEIGDTLIYSDNAWIHIPSGNETETSIQGTTGQAIRGGIHIVTANNSNLITAKTTTNSDGYSGNIELDLQAASILNDTVTPGYFNQAIYNNLKNLIPASSTYTPIVKSGYKIGDFTANSTNTPIYIPKLVVDTTNLSQPKIKYEGDSDVINIKSTGAITLASSSTDNSISIGLNVADNQPLAIDNNQLILNIWKSTDTNNNQGLITFETFASGLFDNVLFIEVKKPSQLSDTEIDYLKYTES